MCKCVNVQMCRCVNELVFSYCYFIFFDDEIFLPIQHDEAVKLWLIQETKDDAEFKAFIKTNDIIIITNHPINSLSKYISNGRHTNIIYSIHKYVTNVDTFSLSQQILIEILSWSGLQKYTRKKLDTFCKQFA